MAELAASIIGIVSAGTKVYLVLSQLAADMGSAGKEAQMIATEVRCLCATLKTFECTIHKISTSPYYAHCADVIRDMTESSLEMYDEVLQVVDSLRKIAATQGSSFKIRTRLQWAAFQKPKITVLRAALEAYKSTLALQMATLNIVEKAERRVKSSRTDGIIAEDEEERTTVESLDLAQRASLVVLQQAEEEYREVSTPQAASNDRNDNEIMSSVDQSMPVNAGLFGQGAAESTADDYIQVLRNEVASLRSSRSSILSLGGGSLQRRISEHGNRLSQVWSEDQSHAVQNGLNISSGRRSSGYSSLRQLTLPDLHGIVEEDGISGQSDTNQIPSPRGIRTHLPPAADEEYLFILQDVMAMNFWQWMGTLTLKPRHYVLRHLVEDFGSLDSSVPQSDSDELSQPVPEVSLLHSPFTSNSSTVCRGANINRKGSIQMENLPSMASQDTSAPPDLESNRVDPSQPVTASDASALTPSSSLASPIASSGDGDGIPDEDLVALAKTQIATSTDAQRNAITGEANEVLPFITVVLGSKNIYDLPEEFIDVIKDEVERLAFSHNYVSSLTDRFAECSRLRYLNVRFNSFMEFPKSILNLHSLKILNISRNRIHTLPEQLSNLTMLKALAIQRNKIEKLPFCIADMASLTYLKLHKNPLTFPPPEICSIEKDAPAPTDEKERDAIITARVKRYLHRHGRSPQLIITRPR